MPDSIRVCLYNPDPDRPLHQPFDGIPNVHILAQASTRDELMEWIRHGGGVDLAVVNLDSDDGMDVVERVAGAAPGCGVIGISSRTDPTTIIRAMRAGCGQFVPWPVDVDDLRAAVDRISTAARPVESRVSKRICVVGSSGGAGATTIACNLAIELAHLLDRKCAMIDMNLELGDVACFFDCRPSYSVVDLCSDDVDIDDMMLDQAFHQLPCGVSALVRPERLEQAREVTPGGVANMLAVARETFPFVVVDLPRSFSFLSAAALKESDRLLIVTQLGVSFIRNAIRIYQCMVQMGAPEETIDIVLNRCKADHAHLSPEDVEAHFSKPVFAMIPNDYRRVQSSLDHGQGILTDAPKSPARLAIREMARKIAGIRPQEDASGETPGLIGRLLGRKSRGAPAGAHAP